MRRFQLSFRRQPGQVIETLLGDLRSDVDALDAALAEIFDVGCSLHRGDCAALAHRLAQPGQAVSVAARVDDRRHSVGVLGLERFDDVGGHAIDHLVGAQALHVFGLALARDADDVRAAQCCQLDAVASDPT